jgi:hypothetical protein
MGNRVKTKTVNLGRLPVFCGTWHDGVGYHKYNIVTYYGSSFINLVEGNLKYPVKIQFDASNRLESYKFEYDDGSWTGWMFVSNAFDASIYAMQMGDYAKYEGDKARDIIEENFFSLEIEEDGNIYATYALDGNIKDAYIEDDGDIILEYDYEQYREVVFHMENADGVWPAPGMVVKERTTSKQYTVLYYNKNEMYIECSYNDVTGIPQDGFIEFNPGDSVHTLRYTSFVVQ